MAGQSTYAFGNCTWYVAGELGWVQGGWGNAGDWAAAAARAGFSETMTPTVGAVVVYAAGDGYSTFGHCAVVEALAGPGQFQVREMNYVAFDTVDHRVSNMFDVAAFILPPGVAAGSSGPPPLGAGSGPVPQGFGEMVAAWGYLRQWTNERYWQQDAWVSAGVSAVRSVR